MRENIRKIPRWLELPLGSGCDNLDDLLTTRIHAEIIRKKGFLRKLYTDFYFEFQKSCILSSGVYIELGSGGGFLKEVIPQAVTTDVISLDNINICCSALNMPFKAGSIDALFMFNVFHHIKSPETFFSELHFSLKKGGKMVMIEPANTLWGRFIYKNFHHEDFNPSGDWFLEGEGRLSSANGALPWIVFVRDLEKFKQKFPEFKINKIRFHTPFRYLISGGVSVKQLLPSGAYGFVKGIEWLLSPFNRWIGMFMTVELEKVF